MLIADGGIKCETRDMYKFALPPIAKRRPSVTTGGRIEEDHRETVRVRVQIAAYLRAAGECQTTVITDLTADGAGLDGAIAIFPGDSVEIELITGRRIPGQVIWWLMGSCGVQFTTPLAQDDPLLTSVSASETRS